MSIATSYNTDDMYWFSLEKTSILSPRPPIYKLQERLFNASRNGNLSEIKNSLAWGVDVCAKCNEALYWAIVCGHLEVVKFLIDKAGSRSFKNSNPFQFATRANQLEILQYLIDHFPTYHHLIYNAFQTSVLKDNLEAFKILLGSDVDIRFNNDTILNMARVNRRHTIVRCIIASQTTDCYKRIYC